MRLGSHYSGRRDGRNSFLSFRAGSHGTGWSRSNPRSARTVGRQGSCPSETTRSRLARASRFRSVPPQGIGAPMTMRYRISRRASSRNKWGTKEASPCSRPRRGGRRGGLPVDLDYVEADREHRFPGVAGHGREGGGFEAEGTFPPAGGPLGEHLHVAPVPDPAPHFLHELHGGRPVFRATYTVPAALARNPITGHRATSAFGTKVPGKTLPRTGMSAYPRWLDAASAASGRRRRAGDVHPDSENPADGDGPGPQDSWRGIPSRRPRGTAHAVAARAMARVRETARNVARRRIRRISVTSTRGTCVQTGRRCPRSWPA